MKIHALIEIAKHFEDVEVKVIKLYYDLKLAETACIEMREKQNKISEQIWEFKKFRIEWDIDNPCPTCGFDLTEKDKREFKYYLDQWKERKAKAFYNFFKSRNIDMEIQTLCLKQEVFSSCTYQIQTAEL
jgi:hypothetical protein